MTFYEFESEDHERQATALLAELGKFVVSFERVCDGMRNSIECALWRKSGLRDSSHYAHYEDLVHRQTAGRLRKILRREYMQLSDQDDEDKACVDNLLLRIAELSTARNNLIHAYWFLNFDYEDATEEFRALALAHTRQGQEPISQTISVGRDTLSNAVLEATVIQVLLRRLTYCLNQRGFKVSKEFGRSLSMNSA